MTDWRPIDTAPQDGTAFQARIPGHGEDNIIAWTDGLIDSEGTSTGGWMFIEDQEPPQCWTDGICWAVNEDGVPSVQPTHWKPRYWTKEEIDDAKREGARIADCLQRAATPDGGRDG